MKPFQIIALGIAFLGFLACLVSLWLVASTGTWSEASQGMIVAGGMGLLCGYMGSI